MDVVTRLGARAARALPLLLIALVGCEAEPVACWPTVSVAVGVVSVATPTPPPAPTPTQCTNCGGTGYLGDGRTKTDCPECDTPWTRDYHASLPSAVVAAEESHRPVLLLILSDDSCTRDPRVQALLDRFEVSIVAPGDLWKDGKTFAETFGPQPYFVVADRRQVVLGEGPLPADPEGILKALEKFDEG